MHMKNASSIFLIDTDRYNKIVTYFTIRIQKVRNP